MGVTYLVPRISWILDFSSKCWLLHQLENTPATCLLSINYLFSPNNVASRTMYFLYIEYIVGIDLFTLNIYTKSICYSGRSVELAHMQYQTPSIRSNLSTRTYNISPHLLGVSNVQVATKGKQLSIDPTEAHNR